MYMHYHCYCVSMFVCVGFVAAIAIGSIVGGLLLLTLLVNFISIFVWLKKRKQKMCTVAANVMYRQRQSVDSESVSLSNNDYKAVNVDEISSGYKLNTQQPQCHAEVDELSLYDSPEDLSIIVNYQTLTRGGESILSEQNDIIHIKPNVAYQPTIIQMYPNAAYASAEELQSVEELEISREEHEYDYVIQI